MPEPPPPQSFSARVTDLVRRLGVPVVVLLAALVFDLVFVTDAALDNFGPRFVDFELLPGILTMAGCAIWARRRAAVAAMVASFALVFFTIVQRELHTPAYSSVLANLSITDVVAGVEILYYVTRRVRPGVAFAVISSLVIGTLIAVFGRYRYGDLSYSTILQALLFGSFLLVATVVIGIAGRAGASSEQREQRMRRLRRANALAMGQWPLIGGLAIALLFEFGFTYDSGTRAFPVLFCSIGAGVVAVLSPRRPGDAMLGVAGLLLLSALVTPFLRLGYDYEMAVGIPPAQVIAGIGVVVNLVRAVPLPKAWPRIAVLTAVVSVGSVLNANRGGFHPLTDPQEVGSFVVAGALVLGLSVAVGLFLRSRDSERAQVVKAAVSDAQTTERMALARELHDVVAHHVTGIVVQAQAARLMGEQNPQLALEAMSRIEDAGTEALAAMRRLVRSMRGDSPAGASELSEQATTDLEADLRKLVDGANHNIETTLTVNLPPHLPHEVGRSALRLVQESLTNVGKHAADATEAFVHAEVVRDELHLEVRDNGKGQARRPAGGSGGYGLVGMRERVALLHGRLDAGPGPDGGWRVEAWLPLEANGDDE
ncbi:MAG TPA: histidine kinase [Amycolatopsis sp.]|nr:histidine kinase [Amycolatopsis sp.]